MATYTFIYSPVGVCTQTLFILFFSIFSSLILESDFYLLLFFKYKFVSFSFYNQNFSFQYQINFFFRDII